MHLFPTIEYTCCSIYDQYYMYNNWRSQVKVNLKRFYENQEEKTKDLYLIVRKILKLNMNRLLRVYRLPYQKKNLVLKQWRLLFTNNKKVDKDILKASQFQQKVGIFMRKMKSAFYGVICDWENHQYINTETKTIVINQTSCAYMVKNTIDFSYLYHFKVIKEIYRIVDIILAFNNTFYNSDVKLQDYKKIFENVRKCYKAYKRGKYEQCYDYCDYFKVNSLSPVMEGYTAHINLLIAHLKQFREKAMQFIPKKKQLRPSKSSGYIKVWGRRRILVMNDKIPEIEHIRRQEIKKKRSEFPRYVVPPGDPYKPYHLAGGMDKEKLFAITRHEKHHYRERLKNYVDFIKNKLMDYDYQTELIEEENPNDIFIQTPNEIEGIENYQTVTEDLGINLKNIVRKSNINKTFRDLLSHVKRNSIYELTFEPLDPKLVLQLNDIGDRDLRNFHQNNYLLFRKEYGEKLDAERMKKIGKEIAYDLIDSGYSLMGAA